MVAVGNVASSSDQAEAMVSSSLDSMDTSTETITSFVTNAKGDRVEVAYNGNGEIIDETIC